MAGLPVRATASSNWNGTANEFEYAIPAVRTISKVASQPVSARAGDRGAVVSSLPGCTARGEAMGPAELAPNPEPSASGPAWYTRRAVHLALIAAAAVVAYAGTLRGTFDFDTPNLVLYNGAVHGFSLANLRAVLTTQPNGVEYLPVRDLTYMLDFELWGMQAFGYHLSNVVYYAAGCALLYLLLERLLAGWSDRPRLVAAVAAGLFVLHPVHVESVAGLAQRKDVISGLLCFAGLLAFQRWAERGGTRAYAVALAALVLAILAKATAVVFPGLAALVAFRLAWRDRRVKLGLAGLAATGLLLAGILAREAAATGILSGQTVPVWLRVLTYGKAAAWYARMLLVPWPLSVIHDVGPVTSPLDPGALAALAVIAALAVLGVRHARRYPVLVFSLAWFLVAIVPVSGLLPAPNLVAERYLFLPSVAFALAAAWLVVDASALRGHAAAVVAASAIAILHAGVVAVRVAEWRTNGGLLVADLSRHPGSARLTSLLGRYDYANGRSDQATVDVQCLLGMAFERMGRLDEARARYERALRANRLMGIVFRTEAENGLARLAGAGR